VFAGNTSLCRSRSHRITLVRRMLTKPSTLVYSSARKYSDWTCVAPKEHLTHVVYRISEYLYLELESENVVKSGKRISMLERGRYVIERAVLFICVLPGGSCHISNKTAVESEMLQKSKVSFICYSLLGITRLSFFLVLPGGNTIYIFELLIFTFYRFIRIFRLLVPFAKRTN